MKRIYAVTVALCSAAALAACGGGGGGGGHAGTSAGSTGTAAGTTATTASAANPCSVPAPPASAHEVAACWFAVTSRFPGGASFTSSISKPSGSNHVGVIAYVGRGQGTDVPAIRVAGPEYGYSGLSLEAAAKKFVSGEGGHLKARPGRTTLGGQPALAYFGTNFRGDEYGLVITVRTSGSGAGAYTVQLTAKPSVFRTYVAGLDAVLKSFRFLH